MGFFGPGGGGCSGSEGPKNALGFGPTVAGTSKPFTTEGPNEHGPRAPGTSHKGTFCHLAYHDSYTTHRKVAGLSFK